MENCKYDFDKIIDRKNTNCGKWDTMAVRYQRDDLIHLGVADMDFAAPEAVIQGLQECVNHGIFGYTDLNDGFYQGIIRWMRVVHNTEVKREEIVFCPRINISSSICVETFTQRGDEVMIHTPAYGPLYQAIVKNDRKVLDSPLKRTECGYEIDFEHMEKVVSNKTKLLILCSPHNPVGRVWTLEELVKAGQFCLKHNLLMFVDEIHGDIVGEGVKFTSALTLPEDIRNIVIQASSPTKTFNVPGVIVSYMVIQNAEIREKIKMDIDRLGMHNPTIFSASVVENVYTKCDDWYRKLLKYINENETYTRTYFAEFMPAFEICPREGTYLLWISYEKLGCTEEALERWFIEEARVSVYMGTVFQQEGRGYIRLNIASPRKLLEEAFERMRIAYRKKI